MKRCLFDGLWFLFLTNTDLVHLMFYTEDLAVSEWAAGQYQRDCSMIYTETDLQR